MRGRYYARHTVYHTINNRQRNKNLNENYKSEIKRNAIDYLRKSDESTDNKVTYLRGLTHDVYRYGRKYKYECNLSSLDVSYIIRSVNDDELHKAYFGKTIAETNAANVRISLWIILVAVLFFVFLIALKF